MFTLKQIQRIIEMPGGTGSCLIDVHETPLKAIGIIVKSLEKVGYLCAITSVSDRYKLELRWGI